MKFCLVYLIATLALTFGSMGIQGVDIELAKSASRKAKVNVSRTQDSIGYTRS